MIESMLFMVILRATLVSLSFCIIIATFGLMIMLLISVFVSNKAVLDIQKSVFYINKVL